MAPPRVSLNKLRPSSAHRSPRRSKGPPTTPRFARKLRRVGPRIDRRPERRQRPAVAGARLRRELQVIFREEVRESGEALARHVQAFIDDADKMVAAGHIERILHGIKGGAGAAGFPEVHKLSEQLRRNFEGVIIGSTSITPAFIEQQIRDLEAHAPHGRRAAPRRHVREQRPPRSDRPPEREAPGRPWEGELDTMFHDEARDLLVPLQGYLQKLLENPKDESSSKSVERIFTPSRGAPRLPVSAT